MGVSYLSNKACTRSVSISGKGTFAVSKISKNELIAVFGGHVMKTSEWENLGDDVGSLALPLNEDLVIVPKNIKESGDGDFVNHSCNPNSGICGQIFLVAMRDIEIGEEITFDYAMVLAEMPKDECAFECHCGSDVCRGEITPDDWKLKSLQKKYSGFFSYYVQKNIDRNES